MESAGGKAGPGGRSWRFWVSLIAIVLTVLFIAVNSQEVKVNFIAGTATLPLIFALVIAVGLGAVLGHIVPRLRNKG